MEYAAFRCVICELECAASEHSIHTGLDWCEECCCKTRIKHYEREISNEKSAIDRHEETIAGHQERIAVYRKDLAAAIALKKST